MCPHVFSAIGAETCSTAGALGVSCVCAKHAGRGVLGVGADLRRWSDEQRAEAAHWISLYKELRPLTLAGDLHRLSPAGRPAVSALQYMAKARAAGVLFAFRTHLPRPRAAFPCRLRGLDPAARYEVEGCGVRSGAAWMWVGIDLALRDYESTVRRITRLDAKG